MSLFSWISSIASLVLQVVQAQCRGVQSEDRVCVFVCVCVRERECVCERERKKGRQRGREEEKRWGRQVEPHTTEYRNLEHAPLRVRKHTKIPETRQAR